MESGDPIAALRELKRKQIAAATLATEKYADLVLGEAGRIVLLDEGTLAASADRETEVTPTSVEVTMSFGTPYGARRHEELGVTPSVAGRRPKFLEEPANRAAPRYPAILAAALKGVT